MHHAPQRQTLGMGTSRHVLLFVALLLLLLSPPCLAQPECSASNEEGRVLCAASHNQDLSIAQVLAEDDSSNLPPHPPSAKTADDVWAAAYNQWVHGSGQHSEHKPARGVDNALRKARKPFANDDDDDDGAMKDGQEDAGLEHKQKSAEGVLAMQAEDDELALVTKAVRTLSNEHDTAAEADVRAAVDTIDTLCASGDNGRQVAAAGGIRHLMRFASEQQHKQQQQRDMHVAVHAVKALASCAQNNPSVVATAVSEGAVPALLRHAAAAQADGGGGAVVLAMRAAALRALVAVGDGEEARGELGRRMGEVAHVVGEAVEMGTDGKEERRCVVRGLALAEMVLRGDKDGKWREKLRGAVREEAKRKLKSGDVDVREGAAKVVTMLG